MDLLPRAPRAALAHVAAMYGDERDVEVELSTERPLADALSRIRADLDAQSPRE